MIIQIWMHWFWITSVYLKGFLLSTGHAISLSSVLQPNLGEAGLLENGTLAPVTPEPYDGTNSSHLRDEAGEASPPVSRPLLETTSPEEPGTDEATSPKPEDPPGFGSTSDAEDVHPGGTLDVFQYPVKKFTKYSHLKYGKGKGKGPGGGEESVRLVEEKVNINISIGGDEADVDKSGSSEGEGGTTEVPASDAPALITTTFAVGNGTWGEEDGGRPRSESIETGTRAEETRAGGVWSLPGTEEEKEMADALNETLVIENKVEESRGTFTTVEPFAVRNRVAAATSAQNFEAGGPDLNAGSITGITLGILVVFSLFGAVSFVLYRRRYLNKPQVLHDKCSNLDSSGYIDETSLKENSEEMYSLDNDSFLNSLEAMTIQNYWTENVKHTKL